MLAFAPEHRPLVERIFQKHEAALRKYVFNRLQNEDLAKEVIQDSAVMFMMQLDSLAILSEDQLYTYLYYIVRSSTQKQLTKMGRDISLSDLSATDLVVDAEEIVLGKQNAAELFDKIRDLPARYGNYLLLAYIYKMPPKEIARVLEVDQNSLRMLAYRARKALSKLLQEKSRIH